MKPLLLASTLVAIASSASGSDDVVFKTAREPKIGESSAFELTKDNRAVLRTGDQGYIVLDLVESGSERGDQTFTEVCRISWTLITPESIRTDATSAFIRYKSEKKKENSFTITTIGGSDTIELGGVKIQWSYSSPERVFLYPSPGTKYAIAKIEQVVDPKRSTAPLPEPESSIRDLDD